MMRPVAKCSIRKLSKPRALGETLVRLGRYFGQYWYMIVLAVLFVIVSTWTQVTTPELTGQATDCFLVPAGASAFGGFGAHRWIAVSAGCFHLLSHHGRSIHADALAPNHLQRLHSRRIPDGRPCSLRPASSASKGCSVSFWSMIALFVLGAILTGATFFIMAWTGQHVLRVLRVDVFEQLHRLSLSYYSEHEAGDLMSRITNDTSAIEQAFSFALVNVFSGSPAPGLGRL